MEKSKNTYREDDRLKQISAMLLKLAAPDFETRVEETEAKDELDALISILNRLVQEMEVTSGAVRKNQKRMEALAEVLLEYTMMNFSRRAEIGETGDEIDAVALGLNTLAEELQDAKESERAYLIRFRESEERYRLILENVKDYSIIMLDEKGVINSWSVGAENVTGSAEMEIVGRNFSVFFLPEEIEGGEPERNLALARQKGSCEYEGWHVKKDQSKYWADVVIAPIYGEGGILKGYSKVTRDNTARKLADDKIVLLNTRLEQNIDKLEAVNSELEAFSYSVSHDLRTPLRAIHSYTQILSTEYKNKLDEEGLSMMQGVMRNATRMGQLIDDLLEFSRIGKKELSKSWIDMNKMVESVLNEQNVRSSEGKTRVITHELDPIVGDSGMLKLALANLISNAVKYSGLKTNPLIEISSEKGKVQTVYCIKDNGAGFDMRFYDKLFGVFQRLHNADEFEGTGVGLALAKRIIERHNGSIWARGEVGKGASFYFSLPSFQT